jgi:AbrB family looped-hinge helix DNA binding protein
MLANRKFATCDVLVTIVIYKTPQDLTLCDKKVIIQKENLISKNILTIFMITKTVKVSEKGQIAIPADIRKETGIRQGDELIIVQEGNKIMIEPVGKVGVAVKDDFSDLLKISENSLMKVWDNKADEVWDKYLEK